MVRNALLGLIGTAGALVALEANAALITYRVETFMALGCGACTGFEDDTGIFPSEGQIDFWNVEAFFTIDTATQPISEIPGRSAAYIINQPLTWTLGTFTHTFDQYSLFLRNEPVVGGPCDHLSIVPKDSFTDPNSIILQSSNCLRAENRMPDYSLETFAANEGGLFASSGFPVAAWGPDHSDWFVQGHVRSITRIPEPSMVQLLAAALMGVMGAGLVSRLRSPSCAWRRELSRIKKRC